MGTYGMSGAKINGVNGGIDLEYFKFGNGENVLFTTFAVNKFIKMRSNKIYMY